jgi:hypothetical protein
MTYFVTRFPRTRELTFLGHGHLKCRVQFEIGRLSSVMVVRRVQVKSRLDARLYSRRFDCLFGRDVDDFISISLENCSLAMT